jgi:hypothetical protein
MDNPGIQSLGDFAITTAGTQIGDWTETDLSGLLAMAAQIRLAYGSGGTNVKAYLQTSLDEGTTAIDIACVVFLTASENGAEFLGAHAEDNASHADRWRDCG